MVYLLVCLVALRETKNVRYAQLPSAMASGLNDECRHIGGDANIGTRFPDTGGIDPVLFGETLFSPIELCASAEALFKRESSRLQ